MRKVQLATRRLAYATAAITQYLGAAYLTAPDIMLNEAASRLASYAYDSPTVSGGAGFANALRNSGAINILLPFKVHGLGYAGAVGAVDEAIGSVGNPVVGLSIAGDVLSVVFADGSIQLLTLPAGTGGMFDGVDQVARDSAADALTAAAAAQVDADAAGSVAAAASGVASTAEATAIAARDTANTAITDASTAQGEIDTHEADHPRSTRVWIQLSQPPLTGNQLDDVWIRDSTTSNWSLWKWTGTVWAITFTSPNIPSTGDIDARIAGLVEQYAILGTNEIIHGSRTLVYIRTPGAGLPTPTQALFDAGAVTSTQGVWYYLDNVGHETATNTWTWADLNDGQTDLAGYRGVVSENPFSIDNPQVLDWAYISGEHRWVRRNSSTWVYAPGPVNFDSRYRSQHAAERAGLTTVGKFIFVSSGHQMRIIRDYLGNVPGAGIFEWVAFQGPTLNLENWAFRDQNVRVQPRKLADFPQASLNQIPNGGDQYFTLRARVHKNTTGTLTSYDLADWIVEPAGGAGGAVVTRYAATFDAASYAYTTENNGGGTGGSSALTTAYPAGLDRPKALAAAKTAYVRGDFQETPSPEWKILVEFSSAEMYSTGMPGQLANDAFQLTFGHTAITLTLHGRELAAANQRDAWFLNLTMVG